jgi:hypothetical protein
MTIGRISRHTILIDHLVYGLVLHTLLNAHSVCSGRFAFLIQWSVFVCFSVGYALLFILFNLGFGYCCFLSIILLFKCSDFVFMLFLKLMTLFHNLIHVVFSYFLHIDFFSLLNRVILMFRSQLLPHLLFQSPPFLLFVILCPF